MALVELVMPKMGESIMEATILSWLKKPGDKIEQDESVLEVATDKVDTEVPSTHAGVLKEILAKEGDVVKVGKPIAIISTESDAVTTSEPKKDQPKQASQETKKEEPVTSQPVNGNGSTHHVSGFKSASRFYSPLVKNIAKEENTKEEPVSSKPDNVNGSTHHVAGIKSASRFYSPMVKNIAKEENIAIAELETIPRTGSEERVTKKDILAYLENRKLGKTIQVAQTYKAPQSVPVSISGNDEIIQMDRMRKMIAERMVDSKRISPHVTSFVEADVTNIVFWRNKMKGEFQKRYNEALTFTPIFIEALVQAIKDLPMINIQVDGDRII